MPEFLTKKEFAQRQGWSPSYITKLKDADRLVLVDDGLVDVSASLKRIAETADSNRDDVSRRHADGRRKKADPPPGVPAKPPDPEDPEIRKVARGFNAARAEKEHYLAQTAKLEYERATCKVVDTATVKQAGATAGTALRAALENLPDQLAPLLAPITDEDDVRKLLDDQIEIVLAQLAEKFTVAAQETTSEAMAKT